MSEPIKLTDDLLVRVEHAMVFYDKCCATEHISPAERAAIRTLRDRARAVVDTDAGIGPMGIIPGYAGETHVDAVALNALREVLP